MPATSIATEEGGLDRSSSTSSSSVHNTSHCKHYQVQNTFLLKVYGPNNCMVLDPLPPHPHIPNPFCALLAGWGLAGSGQQSKLSRLRSSPNFKCTLRPHPFYRGALFVLVLGEAGGKMKMRMKMKMKFKIKIKMRMANPNLKTMEWLLSSSSRNGCSRAISLGGGFSFASDKPCSMHCSSKLIFAASTTIEPFTLQESACSLVAPSHM